MSEVWIRRQRWRVVEERVGTGTTCLRVVGRERGESRTFLVPGDTVVPDRPRPIRRVRRRQALARLAGHLASATLAFVPAGLVHARISLLPFQLEPTLALLAGRRRLLLADAVGMGKTIQAGLLLHTLVTTEPDTRALVVAPGALLRQWADELESRFGLRARIADTLTLTRLRATTPYLANPWAQPGVWLTSPDFLKQPHVLGGLPTEPWDLLVLDEAHQLSGDSQRHASMDALATAARHVAMLTATPHDGDDTRFRRLLSLGSRGDGLTTFRREREADSRRRVVRWLPVPLSPHDARVLAAIDAFERIARPVGPGHAADGLPLICAVFRRRALSTPAAFVASLRRRLAVLEGMNDDGADARFGGEHSPRDAWRQPGLFDSDVFDDEEAGVLAGASGVAAVRERRWLLRLQALCAHQAAGSRVLALTTLLRRAPDRVVLFTHYRDSLPAIVQALPASRHAAVMHGGLTAAEQHRALRAFLERRVDTLVATDVASQGLNLHTTARWALSFDVPWTPLRLEQRIGRVDRLGQTRRVHATILTSRHAFDRAVRERFDLRADQSRQAPLPSCARWRAAAEGVAAAVESQRRLSAHWRHAAAPEPCEAVVSHQLIERWLGHPAAGIACYEVPFVSSTGAVLERRVVAVGVDAPPDALVAPMARRAQVLTHRLRLRAALRGRVQPAGAAPVQPGLFDRRTEVAVPAPPADTVAAGAVTIGTVRLLVRLVGRACCTEQTDFSPSDVRRAEARRLRKHCAQSEG